MRSEPLEKFPDRLRHASCEVHRAGEHDAEYEDGHVGPNGVESEEHIVSEFRFAGHDQAFHSPVNEDAEGEHADAEETEVLLTRIGERRREKRKGDNQNDCDMMRKFVMVESHDGRPGDFGRNQEAESQIDTGESPDFVHAFLGIVVIHHDVSFISFNSLRVNTVQDFRLDIILLLLAGESHRIGFLFAVIDGADNEISFAGIEPVIGEEEIIFHCFFPPLFFFSVAPEKHSEAVRLTLRYKFVFE